MDLAFAAADLVVSRAGAATVSEISALGHPRRVRPYAVGNGEQRLNAALGDRGGRGGPARGCEFTPDRVRGEVVPLLTDRGRIDRMASAAASIGTRTGTENVDRDDRRGARPLTAVGGAGRAGTVSAGGRPRIDAS